MHRSKKTNVHFASAVSKNGSHNKGKFIGANGYTSVLKNGLVQKVDFSEPHRDPCSAYSLWLEGGEGRTSLFRTHRNTSATSRSEEDEPLPSGQRFNHYSNEPEPAATITSPVPETPSPPTPEPEKMKALKVDSIDQMVVQNAFLHHTDEYEITEDRSTDMLEKPGKLVIRRGQPFKIKVTFTRPYDKTVDHVAFTFTTGKFPKVSKGTLVKVQLGQKPRMQDWEAGVEEEDGATVTFSIQAAANSIVGKWTLKVDTRLLSEDDGDINRYQHPLRIYMLFNPWCKDDLVYMDDDIGRDEYVLNDTGKVYTGNYRQLNGRPWNFGQFEDHVIECAMYLLDKVKLKGRVRGDPVQVSRMIAAICNSSDDQGVLVGNWSGNYSGGKRPSSWTGSAAILEQFWKTREPVKYGQCWVFSGVVTTVCRSLGLPCRSVTNYLSAHDCDGSITIDVHWDDKGNKIDHMNEDSTWNFHVWNEVWMARPDLPVGYAGWQAIDATPQELSGGIYTAGPAPVKAIKEGHVNLAYDTPFIFAEVNADRVHWVMKKDARDEWIKTYEKHKVGKNISTKRPRNKPAPSGWNRVQSRYYEDKDREDVTDQYKYKEGSEEERTAIYRANTWSTNPDIGYDRDDYDVKFEIDTKDGVLVGMPFDVVLKFQNKSRQERNINCTVTVWSGYYTGVHRKRIKSEKFDVTLKPIKNDKHVVRVNPEEYSYHIVDQAAFQIDLLAVVEETDQIHAESDDYRLRRPDLELEVKGTPKVGEPFDCVIKFQNSMGEPMTQCEWLVESPGIQKVKAIPQRDMEPYEQVEQTVTLIARKSGKRTISASLDSKELPDVTGYIDIEVLKE